MATLKVSVIIPAYNEENSIAKTLKTLAKQDYPEEFEVIIVDNGSTDGTKQEANKFAKKLHLRVIDEPKKGRGTARATGANEAKGDYLFYTDADAKVPKHWISGVMKYFDDPQVVAVTGPWKVHDVKGFTRFFLNNFQEIAVLPYTLAAGMHWLTGFHMAIRKDIYKKAGGFDPDLNAHEDIDISERLRKFGKIAYAKDVVVIQSGRRYKKGLIRGLLDYELTGIKFFLFGSKSILLKDRR